MAAGEHTLTFNALNITLSKEFFNATGSEGVRGYRRAIQQGQFTDVQYNLRVSTLLTGLPLDIMRAEFTWDLLITKTQADLLEGIVRAQRRAIADKLSAVEIRLDDERVSLTEPTPRTHAAIGAVDSLTNPGLVTYFPRYDIVFTSFERDLFWECPGDPDSSLESIQMIALEADVVPPSEDI